MAISDNSTPIKGMLPIYSQRRSSLLDLLENTDVYTEKWRVEFKIGDEDASLSGGVDLGDLVRGKGRSVPENGSLGSSETEPLARGLAVEAHVPTIDTTLQGIPREIRHQRQWANEARMATQRCGYYHSQSAKMLLK